MNKIHNWTNGNQAKGTLIDLTNEVEIEPLKVQSRTKLKLGDKIERLKTMILGMRRTYDLFDICGLSLFPQVHLLSKF